MALARPFGLALVGGEGGMPGEGIEPPTFGLQNRCTTAVLTRQTANPFNVNGWLFSSPFGWGVPWPRAGAS